MSTEPDYYELLQVPYDADSKEIIATYRLLARQYHPDLARDSVATKRMLALNRAIEVLGDPKKRREYDARRLQERAREALAREAKAADTKSGNSKAQTGIQIPEPRLTRALTAPKEEVRAPTKFVAPPPAPKRRPIVLILALGAITVSILIVAAIAVAVSLGSGSREAALVQPTVEAGSLPATSTAVAAAASTSPLSTELPIPQGNAVFESRGIWLVGADMPPGIWRAVRAEVCAWKRLASKDPTDEAVVGSGSTLTVEIHPSDVAFWSDGCGWWTQVLTPPSVGPDAPFGPGTWLVPQEIAPGSWQNSGPSQGCSWARLRSLDGGPSAIAASGSPGSGTGVIEVSASDLAFHSTGCGTWTRVGN